MRVKQFLIRSFVVACLGLVAMWAVVAVIVVVLAGRSRAGETEVAATTELTLELVGDAWPAMPRVIGYEYNQKNHHDTPSFEGPGSAPVEDTKSKRKKYRVVGVLARNPAAALFEGK